MILEMDNVGILKDASVYVSGLTVITGKNNAGKTTVGKTLYSLLRASFNVEEAYEQATIGYLYSQLERVRMQLYRFNLLSGIKVDLVKNKKKDELFQIIVPIFDSDYPKKMFAKGIKAALDYVMDLKRTMLQLDYDRYVSFFESEEQTMRQLLSPDGQREHFSALVNEMVENCDRTIHSIQDSDSFQQFVKDRTKGFLNYEFHNQIKPVRNQRSIASISLSDKEKRIIGIKVHSNEDYEFANDSSFSFPMGRAIFIDNPFIIDHIADWEKQYPSWMADRFDNVTSPGSFGISSHEDYLVELLRNKISDNYFENREFQLAYRDVIEQINSIIPGEFQESSDGLFYIDNRSKLNVQNLATGSKMFSIIKILLMNGYIDKRTVLILDEPESHLHPEWINRFAEIIVLLIKEIGSRIVLTTHSPNLLMALEVYSQKYQIKGNAHFYLSQKEQKGWKSYITCIDDNINDGYAHLSIPLIEMSVKREEG